MCCYLKMCSATLLLLSPLPFPCYLLCAAIAVVVDGCADCVYECERFDQLDNTQHRHTVFNSVLTENACLLAGVRVWKFCRMKIICVCIHVYSASFGCNRTRIYVENKNAAADENSMHTNTLRSASHRGSTRGKSEPTSEYREPNLFCHARERSRLSVRVHSAIIFTQLNCMENRIFVAYASVGPKPLRLLPSASNASWHASKRVSKQAG